MISINMVVFEAGLSDQIASSEASWSGADITWYIQVQQDKEKICHEMITGLQVNVRNWKWFFLFLNQNICVGCSKEPSHWAPKT